MSIIWEDTNHFPFNRDPLPRRLILVGKKSGSQLRGELVKLQRVAERKRGHVQGPITDVCGSPAETIDYDHYGAVMAERRRREAEDNG